MTFEIGAAGPTPGWGFGVGVAWVLWRWTVERVVELDPEPEPQPLASSDTERMTAPATTLGARLPKVLSLGTS